MPRDAAYRASRGLNDLPWRCSGRRDGPERTRYRYDLHAARTLESVSAPELSAVDFVAWRDTLHVFLSPRGISTARRTVAIARLPLAALLQLRVSAALDSGAAILPIAGIDSSNSAGGPGPLPRNEQRALRA